MYTLKISLCRHIHIKEEREKIKKYKPKIVGRLCGANFQGLRLTCRYRGVIVPLSWRYRAVILPLSCRYLAVICAALRCSAELYSSVCPLSTCAPLQCFVTMDAYSDENVLNVSKSGGVTYGEELNDENSPNNMEEQYQEGYPEQFVEEDREEDNYYGKESYPDSYYDDGKNNSNAKNVTGMMEEEANVEAGEARGGGEGQEEEGGGYTIDMRYGNDLNKELLLNGGNKKKKNKYLNMFKKKGEKKNTDAKVKDIPYCSFNNLEDGDKEGNAVGEIHGEEEKNYGNNGGGTSNVVDIGGGSHSGYNMFNKEKLKKMEKKKKKMTEKSRKKKKDDATDDKKFSEVYNSIYENLRKKKEVKQSGEGGEGGEGGCGGVSSSMGNVGMNGIGHYRGKNDFYEINYNSSDHINSLSSVDEDSLFNEDVLKKYIIGQVFNIIRTSFHWAVTSFFLFFMFDQFSVFYVYRLVSFLTLFLFTPISIYLVKKRNVKFFLIATNTVRLIIWGFYNIQVNISNLIDIDNNGIDFISKKYDLKINEKAKRKFLTLHQFFFDASFIVLNPLIVFVMYLFGNLFDDSYLRDVFIYLSSFIFALITIITLVVYTTGLENAESMLRRNESNHNSNSHQSQNTADSLEDVLDEERGEYNTGNDGEGESEDEKGNGKTKGRVTTGAKENDFVGYYAKQDNNKRDNCVTYGTYPNIYSDQTKKYLTERSHNEYDDYVGGEEISLSDQYRKQFYELLNNIMRIKSENMLLFYVCSLSYLNSVEDIMILMLIPLTPLPHCSASAPHLYRIFTASVPHLHRICTASLPHLHRIFTASSPHLHRIFTSLFIMFYFFFLSPLQRNNLNRRFAAVFLFPLFDDKPCEHLQLLNLLQHLLPLLLFLLHQPENDYAPLRAASYRFVPLHTPRLISSPLQVIAELAEVRTGIKVGHLQLCGAIHVLCEPDFCHPYFYISFRIRQLCCKLRHHMLVPNSAFGFALCMGIHHAEERGIARRSSNPLVCDIVCSVLCATMCAVLCCVLNAF
ncbi:conserved Plasmodium protein, unknown function [Plasmodium ovale wallikeri]|uniref:Uncharacterized protein n=1 Tax=Plasmodium ovale wallikeri TaxID=864142 RepID=A0A1A8YUK0_PLAOA|nr:conserved Plasmodium protein, unknown function [Plasmodium ovale wallikeri]